MTDIHDIKPIIESKGGILIIGFALLTVLCVLAIVVVKHLRKRQSEVSSFVPTRKSIVDYKAIALKRLTELERTVRHDKEQIWGDHYFNLSSIIRSFLEDVKDTSALSMTKTEVSINITQEFDRVLRKCYTVEFRSDQSTENEAIEYVNRARKLIEQCN